MVNDQHNRICPSCAFIGAGKYCQECGHPFEVKRISLNGLLHDVFHVFTHIDKGFGYTLKELFVHPGKMQRWYVEGERVRHQKPFSMFLICATVAALIRYWIYESIISYYQAGSSSEAYFLNEYMVLLHLVLMPVYTLITFLFFYNAKYNFAEIGVLLLYSISFFLFLSIFITLLKFIWPHLDTAYVELPILVVYNAVTFIHFFNASPHWLVVIKSVLVIFTIFFLIQLLEDQIVHYITNK